MSKFLHIVCLDAPSPPDYGGAIDMFYKIKSLAEIGHKIILHYFHYNPMRHVKGLENFCTAIYAYKRKNIFQSLPLSQPFTVQSRINQELILRLNNDQHPILLEGLHCSGLIPFLNKKERIVIRMHNDEPSYYHHLAQAEKYFLKRKYFIQESKLLKQYQFGLDKTIALACLSQTDVRTFEKQYYFQNVHFIPCFIPWQSLAIKEGKGGYCLYHGNLSVPENEEAAMWLIQNIFRQLTIPLIVAGKGISRNLMRCIKKHSHITLLNNPSIEEINSLVRNAHINVLPSMNRTGVKLKLLNALLNGRYCITNENGVAGSNISKGVIVENEHNNWIAQIKRLMQKQFTAAEKEERKEILSLYDNDQNARKLSALWSHCQ